MIASDADEQREPRQRELEEAERSGAVVGGDLGHDDVHRRAGEGEHRPAWAEKASGISI